MSSTVAPTSPEPFGAGRGEQVAEPGHEAHARQAEQQDRADRDGQRAEQLAVLTVLVVHRHEARHGAVDAERGDALAHGDDRQRVGEDAEVRLGQVADDQDLRREVRQDGDAPPDQQQRRAAQRLLRGLVAARRRAPAGAGAAGGGPAGRRPERRRGGGHQRPIRRRARRRSRARMRAAAAGTARRAVAGLIAKDGSEGPGGCRPAGVESCLCLGPAVCRQERSPPARSGSARARAARHGGDAVGTARYHLGLRDPVLRVLQGAKDVAPSRTHRPARPWSSCQADGAEFRPCGPYPRRRGVTLSTPAPIPRSPTAERDLGGILRLARRGWWIIVLAAVVGALDRGDRRLRPRGRRTRARCGCSSARPARG